MLSAVLLVLFAVAGTQARVAAQPNVLLIAIDDLNDWAQPFGGHPDAKTPNILALANQGIAFQRAYCPSTECNASRTATMKGVSPATSGVHCNTDPMEGNAVLDFVRTMPEWFSDSRGPANGYYTLSRGKIFHFATQGEPYFDEWQTVASIGNVDPTGTFPYNGYPQSYLSVVSAVTPAVDWGATTGPKENTLDYQTALWAKNLLEGNHPTNFDSKPFFMAVGISQPHLPLYVPQEFFDLHDPQTVAIPVSEPGRPPSPQDLADILEPTGQPKYTPAPDFEWARDYTAMPVGNSTNPADNCWGDFIAAYLAASSYADACVGEILAGLDNGPYKDNTLVVLYGDHGWLLGEKSHVHKRQFWEDSSRVPLVIKLPNNDPLRQVGNCNRVVNLLDLYPTLTEYCGLPSGINPDNEGRSFLPLLRDPNMAWDHPTLMSVGFAGRADHCVVDERWKYARCYDGTEELYDLSTDPNEYTNLANLGQQVYEDEKERLRHFMPDLTRPGHRAWRLPYGGQATKTLAHWRMDPSEIGNAPNQLSFRGMSPGMPPQIAPGGITGTALQSFGQSGNNRTTVVDSRHLFPVGPFPELTVEAWVKFNPGAFSLGPLRQQHIVHKTSGFLSVDGGFALSFNDWNPSQQALVWEVADGTQNFRAQVNVTGRLREGQWHHVAGTWGRDSRYNDYRAKLFLDGWEISSAVATPTTTIINDPAIPVTIGHHGQWHNVSIDGLIDEVRISSEAYEFLPAQDGQLIWAQSPIVKMSIPPSATYNESFVVGVDVIDLDGDPITFSKVSFDTGPNFPAGDWLTVGANGSLQGVAGAAGCYRWTVNATAGLESSDVKLEITIGDPLPIRAACAFRNGSGVNATGYTCVTAPQLGTNWQSQIAINPGTMATFLMIGVGGPNPGLPVTGGEVLIELFPDPIAIPGTGAYSLPVVGTAAAAGVVIATQGVRVDNVGGIPTFVFLNAQDLLLGY